MIPPTTSRWTTIATVAWLSVHLLTSSSSLFSTKSYVQAQNTEGSILNDVPELETPEFLDDLDTLDWNKTVDLQVPISMNNISDDGLEHHHYTSNNGTADMMVSCHRTHQKKTQALAWHGTCDHGYDATFIQVHQDHTENDVIDHGGNRRRRTTTSTARTFGSFATEAGLVCNIAPDAWGQTTLHCNDQAEVEKDAPVAVANRPDLDEKDQDRKLSHLNLTYAMDHVEDHMVQNSNPGGGRRRRRQLFDDSGATIDVLWVWTPFAECVNSRLALGCKLTPQTEFNMRGIIDLAISETNVAFALSAIRTRIRLVHAYRDDSYE